MRLTKQQISERSYFAKFAADYALPAGLIEYSDRPDVLVRGKRLLGVEIAHLHKTDGGDQSSEQQQNIRRTQVVAQAEKLYLSNGGRNLELYIDFEPTHPIKYVDKTAKELASIALLISSSTSYYRSYSAFVDTPQLRWLSHDGITYAKSKWCIVQSHDVPQLSLSRVKALVSEKATKAGKYQACDDYWLLIIVEFWDPAQDQYIDWPASECVGITPFERILLYKPAFKQIVEVIQSRRSG